VASDLKSYLARHLTNMPGWRTKRKILVIESDDWGSIRMPSREVYEKCLRFGYRVDKISYEKYDSLLSGNDLELLFDLLGNFKDRKGNHPIITANCVVANPDFIRIERDNFKNYYYELITETFKSYPAHSTNFRIWQEGIEKKIFYPQYHAREHLNVSFFMNALLKGDRDAHFGFSNRMPGCITIGDAITGNHYVEPTRYGSLQDKEQKLAIFLEGLDIFEKLFGFRSVTIIPPNYIWSPDFNSAVFARGVKVFQGIRKFCEPVPGGKNRYHSHYFGKKNNLGQIYLVRNVIFEPSMFSLGITDPVDRCLSDINIAFKLNKPAVVTSHRINYVGFIHEYNRDKSLRMLRNILTTALVKWPEIEFMTSAELGILIKSEIDLN